jgi:hypothetical protein
LSFDLSTGTCELTGITHINTKINKGSALIQLMILIISKYYTLSL